MKLSGEKISRRAALRNFSAIAAGISAIPLGSASKTSAHAAETKPAVPVPKPLFSVAERDRRWNAIRRIMAEPQWNLDAILALSGSDTAYPRYLTQIGGRGGSADVIFPRDPGKPVYAYAGSGRNKTFWSKRLTSWTADGKLIVEEDEGSKPLSARLKALALDRAGTRIGVAKLTGSRFDPEGMVPATFLENLKAVLPGVSFVAIEKWGTDAGPIDGPAMIKSPEEQAAVRRSAA